MAVGSEKQVVPASAGKRPRRRAASAAACFKCGNRAPFVLPSPTWTTSLTQGPPRPPTSPTQGVGRWVRGVEGGSLVTKALAAERIGCVLRDGNTEEGWIRRGHVAAAGAMPPLVRLLGSHRSRARAAAANSLKELAVQSAENRAKLIELRAIPALAHVLQADYASEGGVHAAAALSQLACDRSLKELILAAGAGPPLVAMLQLRGQAQLVAALLLGQLGTGSDKALNSVLMAEPVDPLVEMLLREDRTDGSQEEDTKGKCKTWLDEEERRRVAAGALIPLAASSAYARGKAARAIAVLTALLSTGSRSSKGTASELLTVIVTGSVEHCTTAITAGLVKVVVGLLAWVPGDVSSKLLQLLNGLAKAEDPNLRRTIGQQKVVEVLVNLLHSSAHLGKANVTVLETLSLLCNVEDTVYRLQQAGFHKLVAPLLALGSGMIAQSLTLGLLCCLALRSDFNVNELVKAGALPPLVALEKGRRMKDAKATECLKAVLTKLEGASPEVRGKLTKEQRKVKTLAQVIRPMTAVTIMPGVPPFTL